MLRTMRRVTSITWQPVSTRQLVRQLKQAWIGYPVSETVDIQAVTSKEKRRVSPPLFYLLRRSLNQSSSPPDEPPASDLKGVSSSLVVLIELKSKSSLTEVVLDF